MKLSKLIENKLSTGKRGINRITVEAIEYPIHHTTFSNAAEAAKDYAMKRGYQIDEDDWQTEVAYGGKYTRARPSVGKYHSFNVSLLRNGKPQRKALHFQVYGMKNGYELTVYIL